MFSKTAHYFAREGRDKNFSAKVSAQIQDSEYLEHAVDTFNIFSCIFHRFEGRSLELLALKFLTWRIIRVYTKSEDYLEYSLGIRTVATARNEHAIGNKVKSEKWGQGCHTGVSCIWECGKKYSGSDFGKSNKLINGNKPSERKKKNRSLHITMFSLKNCSLLVGLDLSFI